MYSVISTNCLVALACVLAIWFSRSLLSATFAFYVLVSHSLIGMHDRVFIVFLCCSSQLYIIVIVSIEGFFLLCQCLFILSVCLTVCQRSWHRDRTFTSTYALQSMTDMSHSPVSMQDIHLYVLVCR